MNENIELPEEKEPLLIGKDTNGKIVIQKGKQKIIVHACLKMNQTVVSPLGMTQKSVVSPFSSFGKEEWSKTEVVGEIMFVPFLLKMIE